MAKRTSTLEQIPFRMHPRVFSALGADLVTNDVVAVIELVKNAYDAYATRVDVRFGTNSKDGPFLEIEDDGYGINRTTIKDVWCVVATPFRAENPVSEKGNRIRRVAGEKGLGRLSAARLGSRLDMFTRMDGEPCWKVVVNWSDLSSRKEMEACHVGIERVDDDIPLADTGTLVRILGLKSDWNDEEVDDLRENLSRLVSPFAEVDDFKIFLTPPGDEEKSTEVEVSAPQFLSKPKYAVRGHVEADGTVHGKYRFSPIRKGSRRGATINMTWRQIAKLYKEDIKKTECDCSECGPFEFEIRAWDIGPDDTEEIAETFGENKRHIRKAIKSHKGISVYRDGILMLPKSEDTRDWLGLDLRRISKLGTRLSTVQIVGYVSISAEANPNIEDKSDREGLVNDSAVVVFKVILKAIVSQLENERDIDRPEPADEERLSDLFEDLTADDLLAELIAISDEGAPAADAVPMLAEFNKKLERVRNAIKKRFTYYSRLATVGTIAQMLVHEIRNRTTIFGNFVRFISNQMTDEADEALTKKVGQAMSAIESMERLADTFAPLASRAFRRRRRDSLLEESIERCLSFVAKDIDELSVKVSLPKSETRVAVDPGELDAIVLNLIANSVYWLGQVKRNRRLEFRISRFNQGQRVRLSVSDSGRGVSDEDAKKIFLPGVTKKPGGIGMGLTVASELVGEYGGEMRLVQPGKLGGATFAFDMPFKE